MTVKEFLAGVISRRGVGAALTLLDILMLLDEFKEKPCSVLAGELREEMAAGYQERNCKR